MAKPKIKEMSFNRSRKYAWDFGNGVGYNIGITIEGNESDVIEMKRMAYTELATMTVHEKERCRDEKGAEEEMKRIKETEDNTSLPEETKIEGVKKQPIHTKKVVANGKYKVASKRCNKCQGFISWDGWTQGTLPIHVNVDGIIVGNGDCPKGD